jgi:hypothetical protein
MPATYEHSLTVVFMGSRDKPGYDVMGVPADFNLL